MALTYEFTAESCQNEIIRVIQEVFETMLQTEAETTIGKPVLGSDRLRTRIRFGGAWQGALLVECGIDGAMQLARLFAGDEHAGEFEAAECRDVMGELANIVAGNLKVILPKGTQVGCPEAVDGTPGHPAEVEMPVQVQTFLPPRRYPVALMLEMRG